MLTNTELLQVLEKLLVRETIKNAFTYAKEVLSKTNKDTIFDIEGFRFSVRTNLEKTITWSSEASFQGRFKDKFTDEIFIETGYYLAPLRDIDEKIKYDDSIISNIFSKTDKHIILLGEPGSGKTTSSKIIARRLLFEEGYLEEYSLPLVIRFREINNKLESLSNEVITINNQQKNLYKNNLLFWIIFEEIGVQFEIDDDKKFFDMLDRGFIKQYVKKLIGVLKPLIIFEGFDELDRKFKKPVLNELEELCISTTEGRILITSRTGDFDFHIPNTRKFQLKPFNESQIKKFCFNWMQDSEKGNMLFNIIKESPFFDTTIRPLNLSFLAMLYEAEGVLPSKPKFVYEKLVNLQLFKWDKDRNIERKSFKSNFDSLAKHEFLRQLAFELSKEEKTVFGGVLLQAIYKRIANFYELPESEMKLILDELENHSGLFVKSRNDRFEFPHKSIQEFLTAEYLIRYRPLLELKNELKRMPHELAVATSLSTNPNHIFYEAIQIYQVNLHNLSDELKTYFERVIIERIVFIPNYKTALLLVNLWSKFYQNVNLKYSHLYRIYKLNGVSECFDELEKYYRLSGSDYLKLKFLAKQNNPYEYICTIHKRSKIYDNLEDKIYVPLFFLKNWQFVRQKIKSKV